MTSHPLGKDLNMNAARTTRFRRLRPLMGRRPAAFFGAVIVYIIVVLVAAPQAQQPPAFNSTTTTSTTMSSAVRDAVSGSEIDLMVGRSTVLNIGSPIARVSLTVPDIADAMVTSPAQLLVHGKAPGTISLFVWDKSGAIKTFEVKVRRDLSALVTHLGQLFPGEEISVLGSGKDVVLSGTVSSKYVIEKAADVAAGYVEKKENVVNMLKQQEGVASNQVMLRVRFAEVSRSAMQELGATFFTNGYRSEWIGRTAPPGVPSPTFEDGKMVFSDFLNLFVFNAEKGVGGAIKALQNKGMFQSLAEPNLIATNGKEASFLAGGEYPYPVVQSGGSSNAVTIMFKEFGVRLNFTPTVLGGDLINLKVRPEVSSLDFANSVQIEGFRVPALSTRRTETEVELRDGQTFAIAGLMNNTITSTMGKIPGIGDVPVLGLLFRSKAHQKNQTELVVMITPTILKRGSPGVSEGLPALETPYLSRPNKTYPNPDPYMGSPRYPADQTKPNEGNGAPRTTPRPSSDSAMATPASGPAPSAPVAQAPVTASSAPAPTTAVATSSAPISSKPISQEAIVIPAAPTTPATKQATPTTAPTPAAAAKATTAAPKNAEATTAPAPASKPTQTHAAAAPSHNATKPAVTAKAQEPKQDPKEAAALKEAAEKQAAQQRAQAKAEQRARQEEQKIAEADAKKRAEAERKKAEQDRVAQQKADEDRKAADRLAKERAKREAEIARKNSEAAKKQTDEDAKREKALAEAAARLKQAQSAYQAEIEKGKTAEKKDPGGKQ
jgi:pilus assembly protein CpaC